MGSLGRHLILLTFTCFMFVSYCETDTIVQGQHLRDGQELVSAFKIFKLGFFSPAKSNKRYLGIWYNINLRDNNSFTSRLGRPVWVANRNSPIYDNSGNLTIGTHSGSLQISHSKGDPIYVSTNHAGKNMSATLFDTGNFVLRELNSDGSVKRVLWQSFDYPTDTLLPGMKLGINLKTGLNRSLTSWMDDALPALGSFSFGMDPEVTNQLVIRWLGEVYWSSGLWFNGNFLLWNKWPSDYYYSFNYVSNENEVFFNYSADMFPRLMVDQTGSLWILSLKEELLVECFTSGRGTDRIRTGCIEPMFPNCRNQWWSQFSKKQGFMPNNGFMLSEVKNPSPFDCYAKCIKNCSCMAFATTNEDGTGCEIWSSTKSFRESSSPNSRSVFIFESNYPQDKRKRSIPLVIATTVVLTLLLVCSSSYILWKRYRLTVIPFFCSALKFVNNEIWPGVVLMFFSSIQFIWSIVRRRGNTASDHTMILHELGIDRKYKFNRRGKRNQELQLFSFKSLASATDNFTVTNKLGEGGFGPVYKGILPDGQEVAIKRLSETSGQGLVELKTEAMLIAKLQHTNLVRLIGCCIEKEEKMLIYEYMPNKSLDFFLFDPLKRAVLDWRTRFNIIEGIIQGLLYLHKYSRLIVIHRDLKASNILLDEEMNPKISDFGMARIFGAKESKANTENVAGTYGYMPPEYVIHGVFSTNSDVFSFGVLLLEIVCGRRNNSFSNSDGPLSMIGFAWELWKEGRASELIDPTLGDSYESVEVMRCIHVGLLCVQDYPIDRPSMLDVLYMTYNEGNVLPAPKKPAFHGRRNLLEREPGNQLPEEVSLNDASMTELEAR